MYDPRPFNYEYRRPRPENRSFQSYNAFESLYHMGKVDRPHPNALMRDQYNHRQELYGPPVSHQQTIQPQPLPQRQSRYSQYDPPKRYEDTGINTDRQSNRVSSNYSHRSRSSLNSQPTAQEQPQPQRASVLSTYGSTSLNHQQQPRPQQTPIEVKVNHDYTSQVFAKQQKPFNIISCYSRPPEPLKVFPKYTRENLYYQRGIDPKPSS